MGRLAPVTVGAAIAVGGGATIAVGGLVAAMRELRACVAAAMDSDDMRQAWILS